MDLVARESVSVNREPPATLSVASASALPASMASSVREVSAAPTQPLYPFLVLFNSGTGTLSPLPPPGCKPGFFGEGCRQRCSCSKGVPCDAISGLCLCPPGRTGATCDQGEWRGLSRMGPEGSFPPTANVKSRGLGPRMPGCRPHTLPF